MQAHEWIDRIRAEAGLAHEEEARALADAILTALGERVTPGLARNVASQLPQEFQGCLTHPHRTRLTGGADAFVRRVQDLWQDASGERHTLPLEAVKGALDSLAAALSPGQTDNLLGQLPEDLDRLLQGRTPQATQGTQPLRF